MTETRTRLDPVPTIRSPCSPMRATSAFAAEQRSSPRPIARFELRESNYPPVLYIPLRDVDQQLLGANDAAHLLPIQRRGLLLRRPPR